ncbi:hypothetical protein CSA_004484, partial [Cucumis sativus]
IIGLRSAYRKIFMSTDANSEGLEERLNEVEQHEKLAHISSVRSMIQSIRASFEQNRRGICKFRLW